MIVFEEELGRIIKKIPPFVDAKSKSFDIVYGWGTIEVLNKKLALPESVSKYPLIWLGTDEEDTHDLRQPTVTRNAYIVIATRSLSVNEFPDYQYQNDFKVILQPILDSLISELRGDMFTTLTLETIKTSRKPNYSFTKNQGITDVWNAIVFKAEIRFEQNTQCLT